MAADTDSRADQSSGRPTDDSTPSNWMEAVSALIQSRLTLVQLELRELAHERVKSIVALIAATILVFFAWALILAGGVAAIAEATQWPWYWIAIGAAIIHLLIAVILVKLPKSAATPPFSITRSEFQKDREWLQSIQKTPKSKS